MGGGRELKNDDKIGDLIFQSPNCPINLRRKIAISVLLMQFMICLPLIIIIIDNYPSIFSIQQIIISIIFFFVALNIPLFMLSDKLFPHFEIYTNGIVKPVIHKQPFFEITANVENFIYWHEIRYFISETTNSGERVVKIFLTSLFLQN